MENTTEQSSFTNSSVVNGTDAEIGDEARQRFTIDPYYAPKVLRKNMAVHKIDSVNKSESKVLVLYTGGTIGMVTTEKGVYAPKAGTLENTVQKFPSLHDQKYAEENFGSSKDKLPLVLPDINEAHRVIYTIYEYEPLLDSSNMTMDDWINIALDIKQHYESFDGFVILHGTDTLAYTASALSFMLENLGKTVIITGSQIPIFEARSDGRNNFLNSLIIAGNYCIPEVAVLFNNKLFRGNRTSKIHTSSLDAFNTLNFPPLAKIGVKIQVDYKNIFQPSDLEKFTVHDSLNSNVGLLRLFPSITVEVVRAFLSPPIEGVVLQTYGCGNGPTDRRDLLEELKRATRRGVIIVNCTQCSSGKVDSSYETGNALLNAGVIPGSDMTPEAALTKLSYVLSKTEWSPSAKRKMMQINLRGELTVTTEAKMEHHDLINAVAKTLRLSSSKEIESLRDALYPAILCSIVAENDLERLEIMRQFGAYLSACDYSYRTPLHVASSMGKSSAVEYLLKHGASVHMRDSDHKTPLMAAIEHDCHDIIKLLIKAGAYLNLPSTAIGDMLCGAVRRNEIKRLISLSLAGANINEADCSQRTALHVAVETDNQQIMEFLLNNNADIRCKDIYGHTPIDIARILNREKILTMLENHSSKVENRNMCR